VRVRTLDVQAVQQAVSTVSVQRAAPAAVAVLAALAATGVLAGTGVLIARTAARRRAAQAQPETPWDAAEDWLEEREEPAPHRQ